MEIKHSKAYLLASLRRAINDNRVLDVMEKIPRELFIPRIFHNSAYKDIPIPIGGGQTISQPYIAALMTSALELRASDRVLEVGTGSGYQAAILAHLASEVISVERISALAEMARKTISSLGICNVHIELVDNVLGCPDSAPFDAIIVTAGTPQMPKELLQQMAVGARMIVPIGPRNEQHLTKVVRTQQGYSSHVLTACRFVPLIGTGGWVPEEE